MQTQSATSAKHTDRRALSPLKHGLTGRIYLLSQAEQIAYDNLSRGLHDDLTPSGETELQLVEALVDDQWRLDRAVCLEASLFSEGAERFADSPEATGDPELDIALSKSRVWTAEAKNLNLLSLYESRIHRRFDKNLGMLRKLQADRKAVLEQAIQEAASSRNSPKPKGKPTKWPKPSSAAILFFQPPKSRKWSTATAAWRRRKTCPRLRASRSAPPRSEYDGLPACRARKARQFLGRFKPCCSSLTTECLT